MAQRILALEFSDDRIGAALAERAWSSFALLGTYEAQRAEDEADLAPALLRLLTQTGIPDIVISALPGELVAKRLLTLPFSDRRKLEQAVPFALEEHLPFSVEDAVVAYTPLLRDGKNSLVLAALVRKEDLRAHLDLLAAAGLDPKTVTLGSLALSALVNRSRNGNGPASHLLVELERRRTSVVLDDGGAARSARPAGRAGSTLLMNSADSSAGAIIAALRQTMLSHGRVGTHRRIVSGPVATAVRDRFRRARCRSMGSGIRLFRIAGQQRWRVERRASCVACCGRVVTQPYR
jgi:hypothetical protein